MDPYRDSTTTPWENVPLNPTLTRHGFPVRNTNSKLSRYFSSITNAVMAFCCCNAFSLSIGTPTKVDNRFTRRLRCWHKKLPRRVKMAIWISLSVVTIFTIILIVVHGKSNTPGAHPLIINTSSERNVEKKPIVQTPDEKVNVATDKKSIPSISTILYNKATPGSARRNSDYIEISSIDDFRKLDSKPMTDAIVINSLVDDYDNVNLQADRESSDKNNTKQLDDVIPHPERIKYLWIKGPITNRWFDYLLKKCDQVLYLSLDINNLCRAYSNVRNQKWDSLQGVALNHLTNLHIVNSYDCSISSWVFRWKLPNLQQLEIRNANLDNRTFDPFNKFLMNHAGALSSVIIARSFICTSCDISSILYARMDIQIVDELREPVE